MATHDDIYDLVLSIKAGDKTAYPAIHDALIELGYPLAAEFHFKNGTDNCLRGVGCAFLFLVLGLLPHNYRGISKRPYDKEEDRFIEAMRPIIKSRQKGNSQ